MELKYIIVSRRKGFKSVNFYYESMIWDIKTYWNPYMAQTFDTKEDAYKKLVELSQGCVQSQFLSVTTNDKMIELMAVA